MKYKGTNQDVGEISRVLGVETLLEGSVRKAGEKLRITVQLIDVASQGHLWVQDYDRELKDVFAIQSDIAERVAEALQVQLRVGEQRQIEKKGTENLEAYTLYLKGRYYQNKRTREGFQKAIEYFEQAIDKDLAYARAYAGLADSYSLLAVYTYLPPKEAFPRAKAVVMKALEIDDMLAEAHASLAYIKEYYDWDWLEAEREYKQAAELNPSYAQVHVWYGEYLLAMGRFDEAMAAMQRAQELDPLSLIINSFVGVAFSYLRQYDQAIEQYRKTLDIDPNFFFAHWFLGVAYLQKGMYEEAIIAYQKATYLSGGDSRSVGGLGYAYGVSGKSVEAQKVLDALKERSKQEYISPIAFVWVYTSLGEKDQAFEWLLKAYEERHPYLIWLKVAHWHDSLRSYPQSADLLKKVGLAE